MTADGKDKGKLQVKAECPVLSFPKVIGNLPLVVVVFASPLAGEDAAKRQVRGLAIAFAKA
jgi:hypothetical protein